MKQVCIVIAIILFPVVVWANPFLVCDPVSNTEVTHYEVVLDTVNLGLVPAYVESPDIVRLNYDLVGLAEGNHQVTVRAYTSLWDIYSEPATLGFTKGVPGTPTNLRVSFP